MTSIREATKNDLVKISDLYADMAREIWPWCCPSQAMWVREAESFLKSGYYWILIAEEEDKIVGFIDAIIMDEASEGKKVGTCRYLYVVPEHRNTPLAHELVEKMEKIGQENHVDVVFIICVEQNRKLWEHRGFEVTGLVMRRAK